MVGFGKRAEAPCEGVETCKYHATFFLFSREVFDLLIPYGNLPFAFVGLFGGSLQVVHLQVELRLFQKFLAFDTIKFQDCIAFDTIKFQDCIALAELSPSQTPKKNTQTSRGQGQVDGVHRMAISALLEWQQPSNQASCLLQADSPDCHRWEYCRKGKIS
jgi:hypothetical protein